VIDCGVDFSNDVVIIVEEIIKIIVNTSSSGVFNWKYCKSIFINIFPYFCKGRKTDDVFLGNM
jgi:hypothetical protein